VDEIDYNTPCDFMWVVTGPGHSNWALVGRAIKSHADSPLVRHTKLSDNLCVSIGRYDSFYLKPNRSGGWWIRVYEVER
jgi:hypothetical protein